uniref:CHCH domain-containing protein n=1 Tax=Esox lucius TaxID=8010 RepID=A0AAY5KNI8_ESOLU
YVSVTCIEIDRGVSCIYLCCSCVCYSIGKAHVKGVLLTSPETGTSIRDCFRFPGQCVVNEDHVHVLFSYGRGCGTWLHYYCSSKDRVIFVTKEEHQTPSNAELVEEDPDDPYEERGLILPNGEINWNCPCLGGMASGPCGASFKEAFSCFHYSKEEVKGSECLEQFRGMQECMQRYPELYPEEDEKETRGELSEMERHDQASSPVPSSSIPADTPPPTTASESSV